MRIKVPTHAWTGQAGQAGVGKEGNVYQPTEKQLSDAIISAARRAIRDLFAKHQEHFYYCSLVTTGEVHAPILVAWSKEALETAALKDDNPTTAKAELRWSYADSPYCCYGEEYFREVRHLFDIRPRMCQTMTAEEWKLEYQLRLRAMESAMAQLDSEGLFGSGARRLQIVVNVEVMPPDEGNTERALRLNPKKALLEWLEEAAEQ